MSSRIYRGGNPGAEPIEWRAGGSTLVQEQDRREDRPPHDSEMEARVAAAYQQGFAAGEAAAAQRAQARIEPALAGLSSMIAELAALRRKFRMAAEGDTVALGLAIARRILHRELHSDPEAVLGLVKAAFERCDARETHRLRVSPSDAQTLREYGSRLNLPPQVEIVADGALNSGSAIFETTRGDLDASLETQLGEIERGLADVLRKRSG